MRKGGGDKVRPLYRIKPENVLLADQLEQQPMCSVIDLRPGFLRAEKRRRLRARIVLGAVLVFVALAIAMVVTP